MFLRQCLQEVRSLQRERQAGLITWLDYPAGQFDRAPTPTFTRTGNQPTHEVLAAPITLHKSKEQ